MAVVDEAFDGQLPQYSFRPSDAETRLVDNGDGPIFVGLCRLSTVPRNRQHARQAALLHAWVK